MNGSRIFIDTNIAIYLLNGDVTLAAILDQKNIYISFIKQLELLGFKGLTEESEKMINNLIDNCVVIDINNSIKNEVIGLTKKYSIKLPDSLIAATAIYFDLPILTADKNYSKIEELKLMLYEK